MNELMFPIGKEIKKPKDYDPNDVPAFKNMTWVVKEDCGDEIIWERIQ